MQSSTVMRAMARSPAAAPVPGAPITIGIAGQFYAANEWLRLLAALEAVDWLVGGCPVSIVAMGPVRPPAMPAAHVSFLGWKSQTEAVKLLADCDFLYCPYPFDPSMEDVARQSFPSKLVLYLAAVRAGAVYLPLNTAYTLNELDYFITDAEPSLIVCDPSKAEGITAIAAKVKANVDTLDPAQLERKRVFEAARAGDIDAVRRAFAAGFDPAAIDDDGRTIHQIAKAERHEAIARVPALGQREGTVVNETARGYMLNGRVLRPAMVTVATAPDATADS